MVGGRKTLRVARLGRVEYLAALELQEALVAARRCDAITDMLLLLEHPSVITLGRGADARHLGSAPSDLPVHRVSRGGEVTWHGPGQLVGYPILKLDGRDRDVHAYLRRIEEVNIAALARFGVRAARRHGLTGVWVGTGKIASIGIGIRRWVTMHGFALNVCCDLSLFDRIAPCGIEGCVMTSIAALGHRDATVDEVASAIEASFAEVFRYENVARTAAEEVWSMFDRPDAAGVSG